MRDSKAEQIVANACQRWPEARDLFTILRECARNAGLYETFGANSIQLTHRPSGATLMRLRASGYIEVPFDSMSQNRGLTGTVFHRSVVSELQDAGFNVRNDQEDSWPQIPVVDVDSEARIEALKALIARLVSRANSVKS